MNKKYGLPDDLVDYNGYTGKTRFTHGFFKFSCNHCIYKSRDYTIKTKASEQGMCHLKKTHYKPKHIPAPWILDSNERLGK